MLNDTVLVEAAQQLGREFGLSTASDSERLYRLFRRCVSRPPADDERDQLMRFIQQQSGRLERKELDAVAIAGAGDDAAPRAIWTLVARTLLNLDETITRH